MYAKFVASFEDDDETMGKAFVRSGASDEVYRLQATGTKKKLSEMDRLVGEMKQKHDMPPQKKRREMDLLVDEIKSRYVDLTLDSSHSLNALSRHCMSGGTI
jgi:hypothetical protein